MAKIAVALHEALRERAVRGEAGKAVSRTLAEGDGWSVSDVICTSGPEDRPFEEEHDGVSIGMVVAGTFQYRASSSPKELLAPGSFLLGNPGQPYECGHDHGAGDRCLSFKFSAEYFETIVASRPRFHTPRLPPLRASASLVARACGALAGTADVSWEELAVEAAARSAALANDLPYAGDSTPPQTMARVTRAVRMIEHRPDAAIPLQRLAKDAGLSPFHFLRTFTRVTGATPHQYALRLRLREAALRLALENERILDVALDSGFGDLSNFNRTFRAEFGVAPRAYRRGATRRMSF